MFRNLPTCDEQRPTQMPWCPAVPGHWELVRNKAVMAVKVETVGAQSGDFDLLSLTKAGVVYRDISTGKGKIPASFDTYQGIQEGDLIMCLFDVDETPRTVGRARQHGMITGAYDRFVVRDGVLAEYVNWFYLSVDNAKGLRPLYRGLRKTVPIDQFMASQFPVPPVDEQAAIVKYLAHANARIDKAITAKRRLIFLLDEQNRTATRDHLLSGDWPLWPIGRLGRIGNGSTPARSNASYWDGDVPWLNSSVVNQKFVDAASQFVTERAMAECHLPLVPAGSVLVGITGQGKTRGMSTVLQIQAVTNQHVAFIVPTGERILAEYLNLALEAGYSDLRRISDGVGGTKGALTVTDLKSFKIPLPSLEEQHELLALVRQQRELSVRTQGKAQREITLLQEFRTRLVADVVTGQVDVRAIAATLPDAPAWFDNTVSATDDDLEEALSEGEE